MFSTTDVAEHLHIAPYDVRYWVESGLLSPSVRQASGRGEHHVFSAGDLRLAFFIHHLHQLGIKPKEIKRILSEVRRVMEDPTLLVQPMLLPCGTRPLILQHSASGQASLLDATRPGQYVMTVALETIDEKVQRILAQSK